MSKKKISLLIRARYIITDPFVEPIENEAVAIDKEKIIEIGPTNKLLERYEPLKVLDRTNALLMPGLINAHTHVPMTLFRGLADDLPLKKWLEEYIFPAETKLTPEKVALGTELACAEMIRSGTTSFVDMYIFEDHVAEVVDKVGMRAWIGEGLFDFATPAFPSGYDALKETKRLFNKWKGHPRITVTVCPHTPYTCDEELLKAALNQADEDGLILHIHVSETQWEFNEIKFKRGLTPVQYLESLGLLRPNSIFAHCVVLEEQDIEALSRHKVKVAHCPESNLKLASGIAPIKELLSKDVDVFLGTDGAASNNDLDMFGEMDVVAKLQKGVNHDPTLLPATKVLEMATSGAARCLGRSDLGVISPGALADIITIELDKPHLFPCHNPISLIVYSASKSDVRDVIVSGRILMEDKRLVTINEEDLFERVSRILPKL